MGAYKSSRALGRSDAGYYAWPSLPSKSSQWLDAVAQTTGVERDKHAQAKAAIFAAGQKPAPATKRRLSLFKHCCTQRRTSQSTPSSEKR